MIQAISTTPLEDIESYLLSTIWSERKNKYRTGLRIDKRASIVGMEMLFASFAEDGKANIVFANKDIAKEK